MFVRGNCLPTGVGTSSKEIDSATETKAKGKAEVEDPQSHRKAISLDGLWQVGSHEGRKEPSQAQNI